jgi:hypothetical protein
MGFFTSKATRIAQHRELLSLAKGALQSLRVEAYKSTDGIHVPLWTDPSIVPLECRWWLFTYLESLVTLVYDTDEADLGRRDLLDELAESVTAARGVIAGVSPAAVPRLRAHALMRLQANLDFKVKSLSRAIATGNGFVLTTAAELERLLADCKTASAWFPDYKQLDALYEAYKPSAVLKLPRPSNYEMGVLIADGEALLRRLRAREAEGS